TIDAERTEHNPFAVRRHRRKRIVAGSRGEFTEPGSVRIDDGDLRTVLSPVAWLEKQTVETVEEGIERADTKDDRVSSRRPLRAEHVPLRVLVDHLLGVTASTDDHNSRTENGARHWTSSQCHSITRRTE